MSSICAWVAKSSPPAARGRCSAAKCVGQKCYRWEGFGENFHLNNYSKPSIQYIMIYVSDDLQWSSMTWHVMTCWNMLKHVETCWNMLKHVETCWNCLHRSQDSAPRADHRARPHPRLRSAPEFHKRRKQSKDLSQCQHVSAMSRSFFCFVLSSSPCYRVAAMSAERMCQTMGVVQKTQKDLQHAHFKNIIEYIKCGFQHISTNQTRSAPKSWCFLLATFSEPRSNCLRASRAAGIPWDELPGDFKQSWSLSDSAFCGIWWYNIYKYRQYRLMFLSYMMSYMFVPNWREICELLSHISATLVPHWCHISATLVPQSPCQVILRSRCPRRRHGLEGHALLLRWPPRRRFGSQDQHRSHWRQGSRRQGSRR